MTKRKRTNNDLKTEKNTQKTKNEQHESHQKPGVNSGAPKAKALPAPLVTPVV
jgi:hypothetical protein